MQGALVNKHSKVDCRLYSVSVKTFSDYYILTYYCVGWFLAILEMVEQLNLP